MCRFPSNSTSTGKVHEPSRNFFIFDSQPQTSITSECAAILLKQVVVRPSIFWRHALQYFVSVEIVHDFFVNIGNFGPLPGFDIDQVCLNIDPLLLSYDSAAKINRCSMLISRGMFWDACENAGGVSNVIGTIRILYAIYLETTVVGPRS